MITKTPGLSKIFTPEIEDLGKALLHHQCWFFGRDIWHSEGNLLVHYQFERIAVPEGHIGSNCYRLCNADTEIDLWGWGVFYGKGDRGIFIKRYDFCPRLFTVGGLKYFVYHSGQLPPSYVPVEDNHIREARGLTIDLIDWILHYEKWVAERCGEHWRSKCLRGWKKAELSARNIPRKSQKLRNSILEMEKI